MRKVTVGAAFVLVVVGLIFNTGTGTLSSFGWQAIAAICPLGVVEGFLASKTIFGRALIVLGIAVLFMVVFGKAFCSWLCPVPTLSELVEKITKRKTKDKNTKAVLEIDEVGEKPKLDAPANDMTSDTSKDLAADAALATSEEPSVSLTNEELAQPALSKEELASLKSSDCSSCAQKRAVFDSRHIVLGGTLLSAAVFGFPVFCLICPIGLTFGTIIIFWQWFGLNDISLSLLIYPAILIVELVILKKWCIKFCPLGAMLSLMSLPNRFFRPKVDKKQCLRAKGEHCMICRDVCPEGLDPHVTQGMQECSKCGLCLEKCPASAITIPFTSKQKQLVSTEAKK